MQAGGRVAAVAGVALLAGAAIWVSHNLQAGAAVYTSLGSSATAIGSGVAAGAAAGSWGRVREAAALVNAAGCNTNCLLKAKIMDDVIAGAEPTIAPESQVVTMSGAQLAQFFGGTAPRPVTPNDAFLQLAQSGPGARAILIGSGSTGGHVFNGFNIGGEVGFVDASSNGGILGGADFANVTDIIWTSHP
jgi:hypothetical protein